MTEKDFIKQFNDAGSNLWKNWKIISIWDAHEGYVNYEVIVPRSSTDKDEITLQEYRNIKEEYLDV